MRACDSCFSVATWPANASPPESTPANCDFGHGYSNHTRPTTAWVDSLTRLLSIYEVAPIGLGEPLEVRIQDDWGIFRLDLSQVKTFLRSVFPADHELLTEGVKVRLRAQPDSPTADHIQSWSHFADEIRHKNRYFPKTAPDNELLSRVLLETRTAIGTDTDLFRARTVEGKSPTASEMGAPRAEYATAGRANPVGIAHLYLAFALETCVYETRVANHSRIAVGKFRASRELQVLNLADIEPPDFFSVVEIESIADQVSQVSIHRYLKALSGELRKPVRVSDQPTEYIPTQYLCELAKSLGIDGVLYSSSLHATGRNLVLFDVNAARCVEPPQVVEITSLHAEWHTL